MPLLKNLYIQSLMRNSFSTKTNEVSPIFTNRNPRNLERLRIGYKPDGYHVDKNDRSFWHKLTLKKSGRYFTAAVEHFENGEVIKASTQEWAINKHLYHGKDTSAYINVARVLAQRCHECGITEMFCNIIPPTPDGKVAEFLNTLKANGLNLTEPPQFKAAHPWDQERPEKPWEVTE